MARKKKYVPPIPKYNYEKIFQHVMLTVCGAALVCAVFLHIFLDSDVTKFNSKDCKKVYSENDELLHSNTFFSARSGLVVNSLHCRIPEFKTTQIKMRRGKLPSCGNIGHLTSIVSTVYVEDPLFITINSDFFSNYQVSSVECCYHNISRFNDDEITISSLCLPFETKHKLNKNMEHIYVKCSSDGKVVYSNVHAIVAQRQEFKTREVNSGIDKNKAYKVFLIGLDSISQMGLKRGMPSSHKVIDGKENWFEMKGYTRVRWIHLKKITKL